MANYYVSTVGNNSNAGTTTATAWLTFNRAASAGSGVVSGDIVNFLDGTYNQQCIVSVSGASKTNRITYRSINKHGAKLVGVGIITSTNTTSALHIIGDNVIVKNFDVTGPGACGITCSGLWDRVEGCDVHDIPATACTGFGGAGINFDQYNNNKDGGSAIGNLVRSIGPLNTNCFRVQGIYTSVGKVTMTDNVVHNVVGYAFVSGHCAWSNTCVNNTVFHCGGTVEGGGVMFAGNTNCVRASNNCIIANNIIYDCKIGIHEEGVDPAYDIMIYANNLVNGCSVANWGAMQNPHTGDVNAVPGFVNYLNTGLGNYHLALGSAAINTGTATYASSPDYDGIARPVGAKPDLGAYEYTTGDTTAPILTLPTGVATGPTTANAGVTTNEGNGTLYCWTTVNAIESLANIKANGTAQTVTSTGIKTFSRTGLTSGTNYYNHFVHQDAANNNSNVANSAVFTTQAPITTIYFDLPNATNGSGTSASPKNQAGFIAYTPSPGDTLLFKRGTTSAANNFPLTAGTSGNIIKWGAWYNSDGSDDTAQPLPVLTTTSVLSTYASPKDYTWLDSLKIVSSGISVANDKALIFLGNGSSITNCYVDTNLGCIGAWGKSDIVIDSNTLLGVSHSSANNNNVLIVSDTPAMDNITITYNTIKHYGGGGTASHGVRLECTDATNTLTNLTFQHNTVTTSTGVANANLASLGLRVSRAPNANIDYNSIRFFLEGAFIIGSDAIDVRYNTLSNNAHFGLHLSTDATNFLIEGNTCSSNGTSTNNGTTLLAYGRGIECSSSAGQDRCTGHTIRFNTCNSNLNYGGPLDNGSEGVGIGLDDGTTNCIVYGNTCKDNEGNGIQQYGGITGSGSPAITDTGGNSIIANYLENNCTSALHNRQTGGTDTTLFNAHIALANSFGTTAYVAHNICVTNTPCAISINASCDDLIIANNIFTSPHGITMDAVYSASVGVCNSNDFFGVGQKYSLRSSNVSGSATFAANSYTGTNDLAFDPKWTAAYSLSSGSAAIRAGFGIGTRYDFLGRAFKSPPSIGMLEDFFSINIGGHLRKTIFHGH